MALIMSSKQRPVCTECGMKEIDRPIKDPKMKKMFSIPKEMYEQYGFLRSIKANYLRYGNLTEKQVEVFKKVVKEAKAKKKTEQRKS